MRNLKKSLALVLVLAMVLTTVSGATFSDVPTTHEYSEAIDMLDDLGILTGYSDGTYKPEGTITRAEMCAVIYRTLSGKTNAANFVGSSAYSDVSASFWGVGFINYCTELGVVNGYPDGTFLPDATITYAEAITMIVRAIGMDKTAAGVSRNLSYPGGYIAQADINGINDDVRLSANDPADRGSVAQLIDNAIFDAPYVRVMDSEDEEKTTIAEYVFNIHKTKSVIDAFEDYGLGGCDADKFSSTTLGTGFYDRNFVNKKFASLDKTWIGKQVEIYYNDDEEILAIVEVSGKNSTVEVPATGFYFEGGDYKYKLSSAKTIDLLTNAAGVYQNGEYVGFAGDAGAGDALLDAYAGNAVLGKNDNRYTAMVTLVSNDGTDKTIESVYIDEYVYGKVGTIEKDVIFINSLDGSMLPGTVDSFTVGAIDYSSIDLYDDDDDAYDIEKPANLKKDMKVIVYKDQSTVAGQDRGAAKIVECPATEAEFVKLSGSNYTIGANTYKNAFGVVVGTNAIIGDTLKVYVDGVFGYIVESDASDVDVTDLYYIKDIGFDTDAYGSATYYVKAVNSTGATKEFTIKNSSAAFPTFFTAPAPTATVNAATIGEVVKLKINSSNKITGATLIPAAFTDYQSTNAAVVLDNDDEFKSKTTLWKLDSGDMWTIADNSLIFYIDDDGDVETTVGTLRSYKTYGGAPASKVYDNNDDEVIAAVLNCNPKGSSSASSDIYGYVTKYTIINVGSEKAYAELTIAANGKVQTYETETVDRDDISDIRTTTEDRFVQFDLTSGGKIVYVDTVGAAAGDDIQLLADQHEDMLTTGYAAAIAALEAAGDEGLIYGAGLGYNVVGDVLGADDFSSSKYYMTVDNGATGKLTIAEDAVVYVINRKDKTASVGSLGSIQKSNASYHRYVSFVYDGDEKEITEIWYESYKVGSSEYAYTVHN